MFSDVNTVCVSETRHYALSVHHTNLLVPCRYSKPTHSGVTLEVAMSGGLREQPHTVVGTWSKNTIISFN